jgi:hypothetical protein
MNQPAHMDMRNFELLLFRVDQQQNEIQNLKKDVEELEAHIATQDLKRTSQEKRQLIAGISFLGSIVITLIGVIWSYRSVIFRG